MEMDDVERIGAARDAIHHDQMVGKRILAFGIEPQRPVARRPQHRRGPRIAAGEQRHLVALTHQLFGQIGNDPLGAAIKLRRAALVQGRNLRDPHCGTSSIISFRFTSAAKRISHYSRLAVRFDGGRRSKPMAGFGSSEALFARLGVSPGLPPSRRLLSWANSEGGGLTPDCACSGLRQQLVVLSRSFAGRA